MLVAFPASRSSSYDTLNFGFTSKFFLGPLPMAQNCPELRIMVFVCLLNIVCGILFGETKPSSASCQLPYPSNLNDLSPKRRDDCLACAAHHRGTISTPSHGPPRGILTVSVNHATTSPLLFNPFQLCCCSVPFDPARPERSGLRSLCLWGGYIHLDDLLQPPNALAHPVSLVIRLMLHDGGSTDGA